MSNTEPNRKTKRETVTLKKPHIHRRELITPGPDNPEPKITVTASQAKKLRAHGVAA